MSQLGTLGAVYEVYVDGAKETIGPATEGKRWRLIGGDLSAGEAGATLKIQSAGGVDARVIVGPKTLAANASWTLNTSDIGYGTADVDMKMSLELSAGAVYGTLLLQLID